MTLPLLDEAQAAGARLWLIDESQIGFRFEHKPPPGLLARLRAAKAELLLALRAELELAAQGPDTAYAPDPARLAALSAHIRGQLSLDASPRSAGCMWCGGAVTIEAGSPIPAGGGHCWVHRQQCHEALRRALDAKAMSMACERQSGTHELYPQPGSGT